MPRMRIRAVSSAVAIRLLAAGVLLVAACVPRPAGPATPSPTAAGASSAPSEPGGIVSQEPSGPTPIPSFSRPTPLPAPTFLAYTVEDGDTLTSIARRFHTTPRSIAFWSRGEHPSLDPESDAYRPDRLEVGWRLLVIPDSVFDEDELMDATPVPSPEASPGALPSPTPGAIAS